MCWKRKSILDAREAGVWLCTWAGMSSSTFEVWRKICTEKSRFIKWNRYDFNRKYWTNEQKCQPKITKLTFNKKVRKRERDIYRDVSITLYSKRFILCRVVGFFLDFSFCFISCIQPIDCDFVLHCIDVRLYSLFCLLFKSIKLIMR